MLKGTESKISFERVLKLLKEDKELMEVGEEGFAKLLKTRLVGLGLGRGAKEGQERISMDLNKWLSFFGSKREGVILLSKCYTKVEDKEWFVALFLSSSIFRECLKNILCYPYLCRILFEEIEILKRVFENSFIDEISDNVNMLKEGLNGRIGFVKEDKKKLLKELYKHVGIEGEGEGEGEGGGEADLVKRLDFKRLSSFKKVQLLRIGSLKSMGVYNIEDVGKRLSEVGDIILGKVLERERKILERRFGKQEGIAITVIGLNNYALNRLTYTDRYDILFVYENRIKGDVREGGLSAAECRRGLKFKDAVIEGVIDFLMPKGKERLYNLNYYKKSKRSHYPLSETTKEYIDYISNENIIHRYDLINMRYIAGDKGVGIYFIKALKRLVYRKYLSTEEVKEHEQLIGSIFKSFRKKPIKTIDKTINLLCMLYGNVDGGGKEDVRCRLEEIVGHGFMSKAECEQVGASYTFLKELKYQRELYDYKDWSYFFTNLNKIKDNKLTIFTLLLSKVRVMGKEVEGKELESRLRGLFNEVIFNTEGIFRKYIKVFVDKRSYLMTLLYLREEGSEYGMEGFLKELGFEDAWNAIRSIREISKVQQLGKDKYVDTLILLFELVEKEKSFRINIDKILFYFLKLLECYGILDSLFGLFIEYPKLLLRLTSIFSKSIFLSELLISHPQYLEEIGDDVFVYSKPTEMLLEEEFKCFRHKNSFNDAIIELKAYESLRLGLQQLLNLEGIEEQGHRLTVLAEFILLKAFNYYHVASSKKLGYTSEEYGLVMLGKLGGGDMSFGSDLDIYLVYNEREEIREGYDSNMFYKVVLNALSSFFTKAISYGGLYELDLKLRPEGRNAPITVSYKKLKDYFEGGATKERVWERLLYTKARIYSPNRGLKESLEMLIRDFVLPCGGEKGEREDVREEVVMMRERISKNALKKGKGGRRYLFKKGRGGLLDIEFLVEYLVLRIGSISYLPNNTYKSLKMLCKEGLISKEDYKVLDEGLKFYRELEGLLRIEENMAIEDLAYEDGKKILEISYCFNFKNANDFICYCNDNMSKVAKVFDDYLCKNKLY